MRFNDFFKQKRMEVGTVRKFARDNGYDVAYVSRLENGVTLPPKDEEKLTKLGMALGLKQETKEWQEFVDLAAVAKNELPTDLCNDEKVASVLPAFYRTLNSPVHEENRRSPDRSYLHCVSVYRFLYVFCLHYQG